MNKPRIVFFSGMGVDHRLLDPQHDLPADIEIPAWIKPEPGESLASYAYRLAQCFDTSRPFFLGGISFGGMLAIEMARHVNKNLQGLVLIATAESNRAIPGFHRLALKFGSLLPARSIARLKSVSPFIRAIMGTMQAGHARLLNEIMRDADPAFLKWSMRAVNQWTGAPEVPNVPKVWVHGSKDFILPVRRSRATHIIPGAGHVVNVTHAAQVNEIIASWLQDQLSPTAASGSSVRQETE